MDIFQLEDFIAEQAAWSNRTFGPGDKTGEILNHIQSELNEIADDPGDVREWIDVVLLAINGASRRGFSPRQIVEALQAKQLHNTRRKW